MASMLRGTVGHPMKCTECLDVLGIHANLILGSLPCSLLQTMRFGTPQSIGTTTFGVSKQNWSFGTARQRPDQVCVPTYGEGPGPVYMPQKKFVSTSSSPATVKFGKQYPGSRYDLNAEKASNSPHFNPAPGVYEPIVTPRGNHLPPGSSMPAHSFPRAIKGATATPQGAVTALPVISKTHALVSQQGVHSPGPGTYEPDVSPVRTKPSQFSIAPKAASYFDVFSDPHRQVSPGPVYATKELDRWGRSSLGAGPKATIGKSPKTYEPQINLSATTFISAEHAKHVNQSVHSPGPIYLPKDIQAGHVPAPALGAGPADRFYNRFEPGRIQ